MSKNAAYLLIEFLKLFVKILAIAKAITAYFASILKYSIQNLKQPSQTQLA